jgi:NAD(P) transhydrogenase subunit beta
MPILDVVNSRQNIVIKRGKGTGFAGIENALFYRRTARCSMPTVRPQQASLSTELKQIDGGGGH